MGTLKLQKFHLPSSGGNFFGSLKLGVHPDMKKKTHLRRRPDLVFKRGFVGMGFLYLNGCMAYEIIPGKKKLGTMFHPPT